MCQYRGLPSSSETFSWSRRFRISFAGIKNDSALLPDLHPKINIFEKKHRTFAVPWRPERQDGKNDLQQANDSNPQAFNPKKIKWLTKTNRCIGVVSYENVTLKTSNIQLIFHLFVLFWRMRKQWKYSSQKAKWRRCKQ